MKHQEMIWIALMTGIQVIFLWLNQIYPVIGYWLTYLLPFFTTMVIFLVTKKGLIIYFATSFLLTIIIVQPFIETVLFYLLPAWLLGLGYGIALKKRATLLTLLLMLSMIQLFVLFIIRAVSIRLYETDLLSFIYLFLNIQDPIKISLLNPLALYTIALMQVLISLMLMLPLLERFKLVMDYRLFLNRQEALTFLILFFLTLLFSLVWPPLTFYLIGPLVLLSVYSYVYFLMKPNQFDPYWLIFGLVIYPFINALFNPIINPPYQLMTSLFLAFVPLVLVLYKSFIQKKKNPLI